MVRLNRNLLTRSQLDALFSQLNTTLNKLSSSYTDYFLKELLGIEERIMLAKRLAAIILLIEGKTLYEVGRILKISPTTAATLKSKLDAGGFTHLVESFCKHKKNYISLLTSLDSILHLGGLLPHYTGLDRYRHLKN